MKNKSVQNCRFVHHTKFHCIVTTLIRLFKIEFERGNWKRANAFNDLKSSYYSRIFVWVSFWGDFDKETTAVFFVLFGNEIKGNEMLQK